MSAPLTSKPTVRQLMTTNFLTADPADTLGETAEKMAHADYGSALVVDGGRLIGILTSRDLVRALAGRTHSSEARVREWMTPHPRVARPDTPAEEAGLIMVEEGCHHLPVVENNRPVGLVGMRAVVSETFEPARGTRSRVSCNARGEGRVHASQVDAFHPQYERMRLLIVDDSPAFLEAAQAALANGEMTVVGVASTSDEALERIDELRPDVALVDIDLGDESGFDVASRLVGAGAPPLRVILISSHAGDDFEDLIATSPALGFVAKSGLSVEAIRAVLEGAGETA